MIPSQKYIVGRLAEIQLFDELLVGHTPYRLLNIYGPGGIGKSVVCEKLQEHARVRNFLVASIDGIAPDLTPDRILYEFRQALIQNTPEPSLADAFHDFDSQFRDYLIVNQVLEQGGGLHTLFDVLGNVKDPAGLATILARLGGAISESLQRTIRNRFALDRYLRSAEQTLTASFIQALHSVIEKVGGPLALLMDTYEEMEQQDNWVCRTLFPALPSSARLVILGRNQLYRVNFDWSDHSNALHPFPLPELPEDDAKAYLRHFGLTDTTMLEQVYQFTGGYPLLLVLVKLLAQEVGGWENVDILEGGRDRDFIATQLLERILREERVQEVRAFLEKGAVAPWFDPEVISILLDVSQEQGRSIYDKLQRHSFVERHPYGARLHDKIRELLESRLKFTNQAEYERLRDKLMDYYAAKAGIKSGNPDMVSNTTAPPTSSDHLTA
jgi:hypothetical protein